VSFINLLTTKIINCYTNGTFNAEINGSNYPVMYHYCIGTLYSRQVKVTGYVLDDRGSIPGRYKVFSLCHLVQMALGLTQPLI